MSYYAADEDDLYRPTPAAIATHEEDYGDDERPATHSSPSRRSRKSRKSKERPSSGRVDVEAYRENNMVGNFAEPDMSPDDEGAAERRRRRKSRVLKATSAGTAEPRKFLSLGSRSKSKSKKKKKKSRQELIYDDLYGDEGTNYQEVDDGIVGCADDLCVNKADYLDEDDTAAAAVGGFCGGSGAAAATKAPEAATKTKNNDQADAALLKDMASPNTGEANKNVEETEEVYIVKQRYGYLSIAFGVIQIIVLALMMWQCGIAPMNINPMFGPYPDALSEWGGKNSILIVEDGEWWRLITPIFLHAGVIHLFCNVAVQLELGVFFEREWGSMTWLIIYLTSALGSSVLSVITMPDAVSVGSSGAVMGLFGGKIAEVICRCCERSDTAHQKVAHQVRKEQCIGVTLSVIVVLAFSFMPYVDWAAHLGGLLAGLFVGFMTFSIHMESYCLRLIWFLVGMALTLGFFIPCIDIMYSGDVPMNEELRDVCGYYTQNFDDYECNCMRDEYLANLGNFFNDDANADNKSGDEHERLLYQTLHLRHRYW